MIRLGAYGPGEAFRVEVTHDTLDLSTVTNASFAVEFSDHSEATWVPSIVGAPLPSPTSTAEFVYVFKTDGTDVPCLGPFSVTITLYVGSVPYHGGIVDDVVARKVI